MKIRVTIMTENDKPVELLGENAEEVAKQTWEYVCAWINAQTTTDKMAVEKVEIVE